MGNLSAVSLLDIQLKSLLAGDVEGWLSVWHPEGVFEFPFAPDGYNKKLEGIEAISEYMAGFPDKINITKFTKHEVFERADGTEAAIEFTCEGVVVQTGRKYHQHYFSVIKTKGGKITLYRDFWNPLVAMKAFGGVDEFTTNFNEREA